MHVSARALIIALGASFAAPLAYAQTQQAETATTTQQVIVTGTRVADRTALDTAVPVDVISSEALGQLGNSEINQALSVALPSFTFPRPGLADGTDTVRPATLRGLAPDQTLVLVNSKRRHTAALVNVNGTVGRGSAAVDLNTIPSAAVGGIEVLRDGASAQYGSDAIAGVLNVRLKEESSGGGVTLTFGERRTTVETLVDVPRNAAGAVAVNPNWNVANLASYERNDGATAVLSAWAGFDLFGKGFLTVSGEWLDQEKTVRTAPDWRQQYPLVNGQFDPREATISRYNAWYGEPEVEQYTLFANAGYEIDENTRLYGWASWQNREALSAGFFRRALQDQNIISIYPDGFLPLINPEVGDGSIAAGVEFKLGEWDMDASAVFGRNEMDFTIRNTLNRSLGPTSKTVFYAGGYSYSTTTLNLSGVRQYEVGLASPLNVAVGVEAREEQYQIVAGEADSWRNGGFNLANGTPAPSGAQVFPGFRPTNATDERRSSIGAYIDLEANVTDKLLLSGAVRAESYSDFGEALTGKLAARYDFNDMFGIRGSIQNGFRAPSLQQQFFTATSTNFINGIPFEITTFPATSAVARALGAQPLKAETSTNLALGAVLRVGGFDLTLDAYAIDMEDRIVLSENLTAANVRTFLTAQGFVGIGGGRFFINGVDTETRGVDFIGRYELETEAVGTFDFTLGINVNETKVTRTPRTAQLAALNPAPILFDRNNVKVFEEGTPKDKVTFSTQWEMGRFGATLRAIRYGEVLSPGTTAATDLLLKPKTIIDLEGRVKITEQLQVAIGADNIFDEYPTQTPVNLNTTSNTPFSNFSPFGRSGRYVYGRISFGW